MQTRLLDKLPSTGRISWSLLPESDNAGQVQGTSGHGDPSLYVPTHGIRQ